MRILVPTDAFPPLAGGSGWSTYELVRGLRSLGHDVLVVQPRPGSPRRVSERAYDGFRVLECGAPAPNLPYIRNYFKNERLHAWLAGFLETLIRDERVDLVHGQHVLTAVPSVEAGRRAGVPSVCTVRDYWPVCYWSDLIHTKDQAALCPGCSAGMMTTCIRPRAGVLWPAVLPMIPYMRANLERKQRSLADADAVIAVSSTIAADLKARMPSIARTRLEVIPNAVDVDALDTRAAAARPPIEGPYALYLGKLAPNKGSSYLVPVAERAGLPWPLVIAGDGPGRAAVEAAAARSTRDVRLAGWVDRDAATAWMAHAAALVFPSSGPESLSRVLIEASALGVPIAAMNTGGTPDIVQHGVTGLLSSTPEALADDLGRLVADPGLRARLGGAAREHARARFDLPIVMSRIERLYGSLVAGRT